jgi:hypothetical protein
MSPVVVHFAERFVRVTEAWIYHQVVRSARYPPVVAIEAPEVDAYSGAVKKEGQEYHGHRAQRHLHAFALAEGATA